jgi:hypothetical protein
MIGSRDRKICNHKEISALAPAALRAETIGRPRVAVDRSKITALRNDGLSRQSFQSAAD